MSLDLGTLTATLTVDDTRFTRGIQDSQRSMSAFEQVVRQSTTRVDASFRDTDQSVGRLGTTAAGTARDVGRVGQSAADVGRVGTEARQAERQVQNLGDASRRAAQETRDIGGAMDDAASSAGRAGDEAGGSFLSGFTSKMGDLGGKGGPIAASLVGVAALGLTAGAVIANAIADGMSQQQALADVQGALGLDEETAKRIGTAAGNAYVANFGESVEANMASVTSGFDFGLIDSGSSSAEMENLIAKAETLNSVLGTETEDSLRGVSALVKSGLVPDMNAAFDLIVAGRQQGMNAQGDLIDSISEYSAGWKNSGLSAQTSMALINQSMDLGVDNTDRGADALREFGRRVSEEGDTIVSTIDGIGLSGSDMYEAFKRGGPDAEAAFDAVFDKIRAIEDPVKRNEAAMALLGDTSGDFIGAFTQWDPSAAVEKFGSVEGAADKAANTIGGTAASSIESAKRSIETSADGIKLALAEAFGPQLQDAAVWVSENRGEIIGFLTDVADAGFATLDAMLSFTSGSLRGFASFSDGLSDMVGDNMHALGTFTSYLADALSFIPGMGDEAAALSAIGDGMQTFSDRLEESGDKARTAADFIDGSLRPTFAGLREDVVAAGETAADSARLMTALGDEVTAIPDGKSIQIDSNSPEQQQALEELGLKVTELPDGSFAVTSNTGEGQRIIDNFIKTNDGRRITLGVSAVQGPRDISAGQAVSYVDWSAVPRSERADGALVEKKTSAHIQHGEITTYGEPETEGESYIPHAMSKRARSEAILSETAKRFGLGLVRSFADGGVVDSLTGVAEGYGLQMTSGYRAGDSGYHGSGQAADFSNGSGNTPEQLAFANMLADKYKSQLAELIYIDPAFGRCIKDGEFVPDSFYAEAGDHTNHVHAAAMQALDTAAASPLPSASAGDVDPNSKQGIANTIISEGRKRGMSEKQIKAALMASLDETGLQNLDYGMDGDNAGILQQRSEGWGSFEDRMDPATAVGMFYDKLAKLDENSMTEAQLAQAVQQSGTADGSNYAEFAGEAEALLASSRSAQAAPSSADSPSVSGVTDSGVGISTDGQKVFVTNWPTSLGGNEEERKPILTAGLKVFANGGIDNLPANAGIYPDGANVVGFAEQGTGGEGYVPMGAHKRPRSVAITKQIANRFGYQLVPMADGGLTGFGGWQNDDRPTLDMPLDGKGVSPNKARANAYAFAALAAGGANALLSGFDGKGQFTGKFDTGSNSPALLEEGLSQLTSRLDELIEAAKNPTPVDVQVDIDQGNRSANIAIMKAGL